MSWFEDRDKDTLQISGMRLCPVEIETMILAQSHKLITDVSVAGVSGRRTSDERVPRAWILLSPAGAALGETVVMVVCSEVDLSYTVPLGSMPVFATPSDVNELFWCTAPLQSSRSSTLWKMKKRTPEKFHT